MMSAECYPISILPHMSRLYLAYLAWEEQIPGSGGIRQWYASQPGTLDWTLNGAGQPWPESPAVDATDVTDGSAANVADALLASSTGAAFGERARSNVERLRHGARAVVTGQQAGLFGGPLLTLHKAATAIARARQAEESTGIPHVPVFWIATEDHDLDEVNQASFAGKTDLETLKLKLAATGGEVGGTPLGPGVHDLLDQVKALLNYAPITDLLDTAYAAPETTFGGAFALWMTHLFAEHGLVVVDASTREFHRLGARTLRFALDHAADLEARLLTRTAELESGGFLAQVLVKPGSSLLFLVTDGVRLPLRRLPDDLWKAGSISYTLAELRTILEAEPERLSPNALLRPVFQDTIFPTAAYIGGPAEVAYFAQSEVLYRAILGRVTPVLPRFSATLVDPAAAATMDRHELRVKDVFSAETADALALRLGARAMPIEGKRRIAAAGNAMDGELTALTAYMAAMDAHLGRSAGVAASKMRYQMNRLRHMAASFELQKQSSLRKQAASLMLHLFPDGHPQERILAGVQLLAEAGEAYTTTIDRLVEAAEDPCPGHALLML